MSNSLYRVSTANQYDTALRNIGQVSAYQAQKILAEGAVPGELPSTRLSRFTLTVKMPVARTIPSCTAWTMPRVAA